MKRAGLASYATIVTLIALGSIALAAPSFQASLQSPEPLAATGPSATTGPDAETGPGGVSGSLGPTDSPVPLTPEVADGEGASPDFTACEGLTGLDNAICRHEALLVVHPDNQGLQTSLARLESNRERHEAKQSSNEEGSEGTYGGVAPHPDDGSGKEDHGQGKGHGNANGHDEDADGGG